MKIGSIGFPEDQRVKLEKIFRLSKQTRYELVGLDVKQLPDLLLVFGFDPLAYPELEQLPPQYHSRIILVGRGKPKDKSYAHLGYPLVSSRVLRTLNNMTHENEEMGCESEQAEQENRFTKYEQQATEIQQKPVTETGRNAFRVLVVDDNEVMQQALNTELQQLPLPVDVHFAGSGEEALEKVAAHQYDFVFLDVVMPGIDGFETCTEMRKRPEMKKTPIIMLTSRTSPMDEVKGIMSGCSTYLTKPIVHEEFQKVIARVSNWVDEFKKV
ncbi:MAG: two-component system response regulator [Neptuniibacter caesariensis]|uniref:Two-component system response regulator n=1 Tax=Neptuniibacter caesariensis TaxID=207954 RepID=A0A2G6JP43_NEPCE|nr:MAG: two-component system response regulator [Neptuniibacter caesariensis]